MVATSESELPVGTVLDAKFRITREIGRGGMAAIYEAVNVDIGKRVAVKLLSQDLVTSKVVRERFLREARAAAAIRSPHICEVYDSGMYAERPFLVMELLEGESLYERLTRAKRLDPPTTLIIAEQSARGLAKAHQVGVIHRDLKPENIFLTRDEEGGLLVKLVDFGLAKFYGAESEGNVRLTREGALFGTPAYMSPEQAKGLGAVDHRADLWALGCIVYECLTGRTVWNVEQGVAMILAQIAAAPLPVPSSQFPDLPAAFDAWFAHALERAPEDRFQTPKELTLALRAALTRQASTSEVSNTDLAPPVAPTSSSHPSFDPESRAVALAPPPPMPPPGAGSLPESSAFPGALQPFSSDSTSKRKLASPLAFAVLALGVALSGYVLWLLAFKSEAKPPASSAEPLEKDPYALVVNAAQLSLSEGDPELALAQFKSAVEQGQANAARSLMQRAEVIVEQSRDAANKCRVTGLGRPRPFDLIKASSRPSLLVTPRGPLVAWADRYGESDSRRISSVLLDNALRRVTVPKTLSPEATATGDPHLFVVGDQPVALYSETKPPAVGLFARSFDPHLETMGEPVRVSDQGRSAWSPHGTGTADEAWFVWEEANSDRSMSIWVRRASRGLTQLAPPVRVATIAPRFKGGVTRGMANPSISITQSHLRIAFALELTPVRYQIHELAIDRTDPALGQGVPGAATDSGKGPADTHLGRLTQLSDGESKHAEPNINCSDSGDCFVVWDAGTDKASIALASADGNVVWRRTLAKAGNRPRLGQNRGEFAVAWFEDSRLKLAPLTRDGVLPASILTRVTGFQPHPALAAGDRPGMWYLAWRDFEAGHLEAFVLRTQCQ